MGKDQSMWIYDYIDHMDENCYIYDYIDHIEHDEYRPVSLRYLLKQQKNMCMGPALALSTSRPKPDRQSRRYE